MDTITAEDVTTRLRSLNESLYGPPDTDFDTIGWNVPTFTSQEQVDRFVSIDFTVTHEHETHNGVAWVGTVTMDGRTFNAENDGHGGCNFYHGGDSSALADAEGLAEELYPEGIEALDTMLNAREMWTVCLGASA